MESGLDLPGHNFLAVLCTLCTLFCVKCEKCAVVGGHRGLTFWRQAWISLVATFWQFYVHFFAQSVKKVHLLRFSWAGTGD